MKIRSQFSVLFGLTSLVPLVLFGLFAFSRGAPHLQRDAESALSVLCDRVATRVELWHEERLNDGETFMRSVPLLEYLQAPTRQRLERLQRRLDHFAAKAGAHYVRVYLVDPMTSQILASSRVADQGKPAPHPLGVKGWSSGERGLTVLPRGNAMSHTVANMTLDVELPPEVTRPVVLVAEVDLTREMVTLLRKLPRGDTGKIVIATATHVLVAIGADRHSRASWQGIGVEAARRGVDGQVGVLEGADRVGSEVVLAYRPLPLLGAALIAKQQVREFNRPMWQLGLALLFALGISILATIVIALWLSRRVTRPTESVAAAAQKLAAGDLSVRADVGGAEELRATSEAFNRMVTEVAQSTEAQELARQQAEQANADKDRFIAVVSHELRNPLSSIQMGAELLQRDDIAQPQRDQAVGIIARSCRLLGRLVSDLLELSRLTHGRMHLELSTVSLDGLVRDACQTHEKSARGPGAPVRVRLDPDIYVRGDVERLQQVVLNLLGNARKFTPESGNITVELLRTTRPQTREPVARIVVTDTGTGIEPTVLPQLFSLFAQGGQPAPGRKGLGIGLALVKGIVESHRGRVWAQSEGPGYGSRFVVELPLTDERVYPESRDAERDAEQVQA